MAREVCSSDEELVVVPPFIPPSPSSSQSCVEIMFSNLTKESCLEIKEAMMKWAERNLKYNLEQMDDSADSEATQMRLSGKFRIEDDQGINPRVIFLPSCESPLTEDELKDPWTVNETAERILQVPLYERTAVQLPKIEGLESSNQEMRPVNHHKCFNCGSYHHQVRNCRRDGGRNENRIGTDGDRSSASIGGRGRGRVHRGRGVNRLGTRRSPEEEFGRYMTHQLGSKSADETDRKRSRLKDHQSDRDWKTKSRNETLVIKILTDSDEEDGLEEGEYIENKKQKIDELVSVENELEEGEIAPSSCTETPSPPPPPPPPPSSSNPRVSESASTRLMVPKMPPPPPPPAPPPPQVLLQHVHQNPVPAAPRLPASTVVYMAPTNAQSAPTGVFNLAGSTALQVRLSPLPQNNIVVAAARAPPPQMPTAVLLQERALHRPVFAPSNVHRPTTVSLRAAPTPTPSGVLVYNRNGNPLIVRPRLT
eukprot:g1081.t1